MRDADAEVWLASQRIEHQLRAAAQRAQLPDAPSWLEQLRWRAGRALIGAGQRLLPATRRAPARAA
jgi:hypothetical protein